MARAEGYRSQKPGKARTAEQKRRMKQLRQELREKVESERRRPAELGAKAGAKARAKREPKRTPRVPGLTLGPTDSASLGDILRAAAGLGGEALSDLGKVARGIPKRSYLIFEDVKDAAESGELLQGLPQTLIEKHVLEPEVEYLKEHYGPLAPGGRPASETVDFIREHPWLFGLDVASVVSPVVGGTARTIKGGRTALQSGSLREGVKAARARPLKERKLTFEQETVDLPISPSTVTAWGQKLYDKYGEWLSRRGVLRPEQDELYDLRAQVMRKGTRAALAPLGTGRMNARQRVPKQAAKNLRQDVRRAQAFHAEDARLVHGIGGAPATFGKVRGRIERTKFWWTAQLPESFRNATGLNLIAKALHDESERLAVLLKKDEIDRDFLIERKVQMSDAPEIYGNNVGKIVDYDGDRIVTVSFFNRQTGARAVKQFDIGETSVEAALQRARRDMLQTVTNLKAEVGKLEKAKHVKREADPETLAAARALMDDRERVLIAAGVLKEETAANRPWLLTEGLLGLERAGEAPVFVGHRTRKAARSIERSGQTRVGGGKTRLPEGVGQKNELRAVLRGIVRTDPDTIVEDWQRAQVFRFMNEAKDTLARMGQPFEGKVPRGWFLVNRNGHKIDRTMDADERRVGEGFDPDDEVFADAEAYAHNVLADSRTAKDLLSKSHPDDLVIVPPDVVKHFFNRYAPAGVPFAAAKGALNVVDAAQDLVRFALIYSNPGYIPANLISNTGMAVMHQGPFYLIPNLIRSGNALRFKNSDKRFKNLLRAEVGFAATPAIVSDSRTLISRGVRRQAQAQSLVADDLIRASAWYHEARKRGYRTRAQQKELLVKAAQGDKAARAEANFLRDRVNVSMVDFERLAPLEKSIAQRVLFIWPWIRGATRYPARFAADYPGRSGLIAHSAIEADKEVEDVQGGLSLKGAVKLGPGRAFLPNRVDTLSTPQELFEVLGSMGKENAARDTSSLAHPLISTLIETARPHPWETATGNLKENLSSIGLTSGGRFVRDVLDPPQDTVFGPQSGTDVALRRGLRGVVPFSYDEEMARLQWERNNPLPPEQRDRRALGKDLRGRLKLAREMGRGAERYFKKTMEPVYRLRFALEQARESYKRELDADKLSDYQAAKVDLQTLERLRPETPYLADAKEAVERYKGRPEHLESLRAKILYHLVGGSELSAWNGAVNDYLEALEAKAVANG